MWFLVATALRRRVWAALRQRLTARWSRANDKNNRASNVPGLARAGGLADALRGLELDLAGHQAWLARSAANFIRRTAIRNRDRRSYCRVRRSGAAISAPPV
jgi:hypothetical protein